MGLRLVSVRITLAAGVATWALSPIKFQADMGILLAFMDVASDPLLDWLVT